MAEPRPDAEQQAGSARQLLAGRFHAVLSTHSADMPGFPFGSVVPYCLDRDGVPVFLLSHLSQHTKNLVAESRAALTLLGDFSGDVQQAERLTGVGDIRPIDMHAAPVERYFSYFPGSRFYFDELNFRFFRMMPRRWHWNGGFATARWFGNDRLLAENPFDDTGEQAAVAQIESDFHHLLESLLAVAGVTPAADDKVRVCGVDSEGMDLGLADEVVRIVFPRPVFTRRDLLEVLTELTGVP